MAKKKKTIQNSASNSNLVPVVTVLGHVDHGKTTLLDSIRKTNIAAREHGGITQKIGASSIEIIHEGKPRKITFIDTPGHEAFSLMRGRGAKAADIALLVVSSVDGVMPQTRESIALIKESKIPFIVVLTKSDVALKNVEKVKGQLVKEEVMLEGMGGDVPVIEVSAKTNSNIKELLDLILLVFEMRETKEEKKTFEAVIIESKLDARSGPKATIVVKSGSINIGDELISQDIKAKVKSLVNEKQEILKTATTGDAVEILGFDKIPQIGSVVYKANEAVLALAPVADLVLPPVGKTPWAPVEVFAPAANTKEDFLKVLICADTQGSLEAVLASMPEKINILSSKTGDVETSDVSFAKSLGAVILGFNIKIKPEVLKLSETEKVLIRNYTLIYEMMDEIKDFIEGKRLALIEKIYGTAKILARFPFDKKEVLGIKVTEGRIAKGDKVRIMRGEEIVGESGIISVRQGKEVISKIETGEEGGVILSGSLDFKLEDMLISHG